MKYIFYMFTLERFNCFLELVLEFSFHILVNSDWHVLFSGVQFNDSISYVGVWQRRFDVFGQSCWVAYLKDSLPLSPSVFCPWLSPPERSARTCYHRPCLLWASPYCQELGRKIRSKLQEKAASPLGAMRVMSCTSPFAAVIGVPAAFARRDNAGCQSPCNMAGEAVQGCLMTFQFSFG